MSRFSPSEFSPCAYLSRAIVSDVSAPKKKLDKLDSSIIICHGWKTEKPNRSARTGRKATGLLILLYTRESRAARKDTKCCPWRLFLFLEDEQSFKSLKSLIRAKRWSFLYRFLSSHSHDSSWYTANGHDLAFLNPIPTLPLVGEWTVTLSLLIRW